MKQLIDDLLEQLEAYDMPPSVMAAIEPLNAALESGAFDCLVEHPASEPPKGGIRDVLVLTTHGHYAIDHYHTLDKEFRHHGSLVKTWRELPKGTK